jgi:hypothetical protein
MDGRSWDFLFLIILWVKIYGFYRFKDDDFHSHFGHERDEPPPLHC